MKLSQPPAPIEAGITRRRFWQLSMATIGFALGRPTRRRGSPAPSSPNSSSDGLAAEAVATLVAFGDVLLPSALSSDRYPYDPAAPGDEEASPLGLIHSSILLTAGHSAALAADFQAGADILNLAAVSRGHDAFATMPLADRRVAVNDLIGTYTASGGLVRKLLRLTRGGRNAEHLWSRVAQPMLRDVYRSFWGWRALGYPRGRGECSDLVAYQFPVRTSGTP